MAASRLSPGTYCSDAVEDTIGLGQALGSLLRDGDVVVLEGDLGAGKTQLTKGIALGMGIAEAVTSPTFTIGMTYEGASVPLHHFDLYRLDSASQLEDTGILDVAGDDGACVVEWGADYASQLGDDRLEVAIEREAGPGEGPQRAPVAEAGVSEPARRITLVGTGPRSAELLAELERTLSRGPVEDAAALA